MRDTRKRTTRKFKHTKSNKNVNKINTKRNRKTNINKKNRKITKNANKRKTIRKKMRGGGGYPTISHQRQPIFYLKE